MRRLLIMTAAALGLAASQAFAGDLAVGPEPTDSQALAKSYIESRLSQVRSVRCDFNGGPYQAQGKLRTEDGKVIEWSGWALDVTVATRRSIGGPAFGNHTVVFEQGQPIALSSDLSGFARL